jgi:hypothetical protein
MNKKFTNLFIIKTILSSINPEKSFKLNLYIDFRELTLIYDNKTESFDIIDSNTNELILSQPLEDFTYSIDKDFLNKENESHQDFYYDIENQD